MPVQKLERFFALVEFQVCGFFVQQSGIGALVFVADGLSLFGPFKIAETNLRLISLHLQQGVFDVKKSRVDFLRSKETLKNTYCIGREIEMRTFMTQFVLCVGVPIILPLLLRASHTLSFCFSRSQCTSCTSLFDHTERKYNV